MTGVFSNISKEEKKTYPKLKDDIIYSLQNIGMTSSIHYRLDDIYPEFLDLLQKYGLDKFCVETFMSLASDQGLLHSEFHDSCPPSEY